MLTDAAHHRCQDCAGEEIVATAVEPPARVVNLMDALKKSLDTVSAKKNNRQKPKWPNQPRGANPRKVMGPYSKTAGVRPPIIREALCQIRC
jgi:hypothetical protein